jgi:hypothetical protein
MPTHCMENSGWRIPYAVRALLRDPVERTLSYLKHCRRYHTEHQNCRHGGKWLTEQTFPQKLKRFGSGHPAASPSNASPRARALFALTTNACRSRKKTCRLQKWWVSPNTMIDFSGNSVIDMAGKSPEFLNRIAADNAFDIELYAHAKSLSA